MNYEQYFLRTRRDEAYSTNLRIFERLCDREGDNVLILGSLSGKFTGNAEDFAVLPFKAMGTNVLIIGQKGDGKSWFEAMIYQQLNAFYRYPVLINDLKNEFRNLTTPLFNQVALNNLRKMGLKPMGFNNLDVVVPASNWQVKFDETPGIVKWKLDYPDLKKIDNVYERRTFLYTLLGMEGESESDEKKWTAAHTFIEKIMAEKEDQIDSFEDLMEYLLEEFEQMKKKGGLRATSPAAQRQLEEAMARTARAGGRRFDFLSPLRQRRIVSLQGTTGPGMRDRVLQSYFAFPQLLLKSWRERGMVDKVCNIMEERDAIVRRNDKSYIGRLFELIKTKGRTLSNFDIDIVQDPTNIDRTEIKQYDYIFTTKPNDETTFDILRAMNADESAVWAARGLDKDVRPFEWLCLSASDWFTFRPNAPFGQPLEEKSEFRLNQPEEFFLSRGARHGSL